MRDPEKDFDVGGSLVSPANSGVTNWPPPSYSPDTGLFYIAIPGNSTAPKNGVVAVIDPRNPKDIHVVENFAMTDCSPNGAALGPDFELLLGCGAGPEQVIDIRTGDQVTGSPIVGTTGGCDEVAFNAGDNHFAGACTDANSPPTDNLDISDAKPPIALDQQINTHATGAHSVAADPDTVTYWMPMYGGLCGTNPTPPNQACIAIFGGGSNNGDDISMNAPKGKGK